MAGGVDQDAVMVRGAAGNLDLDAVRVVHIDRADEMMVDRPGAFHAMLADPLLHGEQIRLARDLEGPVQVEALLALELRLARG